jgi:hypothetical protein
MVRGWYRVLGEARFQKTKDICPTIVGGDTVNRIGRRPGESCDPTSARSVNLRSNSNSLRLAVAGNRYSTSCINAGILCALCFLPLELVDHEYFKGAEVVS